MCACLQAWTSIRLHAPLATWTRTRGEARGCRCVECLQDWAFGQSDQPPANTRCTAPHTLRTVCRSQQSRIEILNTPQVVGERSAYYFDSFCCLPPDSSAHVHPLHCRRCYEFQCANRDFSVSSSLATHAFARHHPTMIVTCRPHPNVNLSIRDVQDAYGATLHRSSACASTGSMVIKIIDTCPCNYPSNSYSNKR